MTIVAAAACIHNWTMPSHSFSPYCGVSDNPHFAFHFNYSEWLHASHYEVSATTKTSSWWRNNGRRATQTVEQGGESSAIYGRCLVCVANCDLDLLVTFIAWSWIQSNRFHSCVYKFLFLFQTEKKKQTNSFENVSFSFDPTLRNR